MKGSHQASNDSPPPEKDPKVSSNRFSRSSPYDGRNILSKAIFTYIFSTFYRGWKGNGLRLEDLFRCPTDDEAGRIAEPLIKNWKQEQLKSRPSIGRAVLRTYYQGYMWPLAIYLVVECAIRIGQSLMLGEMIRYFTALTLDPDQTEISAQWAWLCAGGVCLTAVICNSLIHPLFMQVMRMGMRCRNGVCVLLYRKALRLSVDSDGQSDTSAEVGQLVNLMSNDASRFDEFSIFACYTIVAPVQTVIVVGLVWRHLGVSCFVGLAILLMFIPFQLYMGKWFSAVRASIAALTDTRLRYMSELIAGMRVIKLYSWEKPFATQVAHARSAEVHKVKRASYLRGLNLSIFFVASRVILFAMFVTYVLLGNRLTADGVFVTVALFNSLRITVTLLFPLAISLLAELRISCRRIQRFLCLPEIEARSLESSEDEMKKNKQSIQSTTPCLKVDHISARWKSGQSRTLSDISFDLSPGDLLAVIGPVGMGKSSLLMAILHELTLESGKITRQGSLSYASQDPWSQNDSVRNNILFGRDYDEKHYRRVVEVCALERDLRLLPSGDQTIVGERGAGLSGGQRARLNLARAVYRDADIVLMDDPLSAVDAPVAAHIFNRCIVEHLSRRIRILVTHQLQFIQRATKVLVLAEHGRVLAYGTYTELIEREIDFMQLLKQEDDRRGSQISVQSTDSGAAIGRPRALSSFPPVEGIQLEAELSEDQSAKSPQQAQKQQLEDEQLSRGALSWRVYRRYAQAGGGVLLWSSMIVSSLISQVVFHWADIYLTSWTDKNQSHTPESEEQNRDIIVFSAMIGVLFISTIVRSATFFAICMNASVRLHRAIFERLMRTPVRFFDANPGGRILNRFTKDLGIIDEALPRTAYDLNLIIGQAVGLVVTVSLVNWYLALPAVALSFIIWTVRGVYIRSARDIKRFEGMLRSPVYSHVTSTVAGLASVRAYQAEDRFRAHFRTCINDHSSTWFWYLASARAMGQILDWLTTVYIVIVTCTVMAAASMGGAQAGLAVSSGLILAGMTQWGVIQSAEFESQMTSVERLVQYQSLEQERPAESEPDKKPPPTWPDAGRIEFDQVDLTYGVVGVQPPVLRDLNCTIEAGEKIGIVGRTGAGKSSLVAALFRLTEPTGVIRIDGVDIQSIGLDDLRTKVSIIPQEPVVFSGTVRHNLDPYGQHSDTDLWAALDEVQLKKPIQTLDRGLEAHLAEGGANLSVGQRQLICLARAVLRRNRILVLDEATANVDHQTDSLIQRTIRSDRFAHCTVLTVAHRLNTVIDCDRVMVLDAGRIVQFDAPYKLLQNTMDENGNDCGHFYRMCRATGRNMFDHLRGVAEATYVRRRSRQLSLCHLVVGEGAVGQVEEQDDCIVENHEPV